MQLGKNEMVLVYKILKKHIKTINKENEDFNEVKELIDELERYLSYYSWFNPKDY